MKPEEIKTYGDFLRYQTTLCADPYSAYCAGLAFAYFRSGRGQLVDDSPVTQAAVANFLITYEKAKRLLRPMFTQEFLDRHAPEGSSER